MHPTRTRIALALAGVATLATLSACAGSGSESGDSTKVAEPAVAADSPAPDETSRQLSADGAFAVADAPGEDAGAPTEGKAAEEDLPEAAVISTGTVELESDDVARARFDVRRIVDQQRGTVTEQETTTGDDGKVATARLVVRVPSARFADTTAALEEVATLTDSTSTSQDVTTKVVDVAARVRAQRRSVARIEALLDRAQNLSDVVSIERQLAERQANLDALVARQRSLADQTSLSTITVSIALPDDDGTPPEEDDDSGFLGGLRDGWDSFVDGVVVALTVVGFALPWLILVAVLGAPLWLLARRRAARRPGPAPATPGTPATP